MGTFELLNLVGSTAVSLIGTLWANNQAALQREREWRLKVHEARHAGTEAARAFGGHWHGYYWARVLIALLAVGYLFGLPVAAVFVDGVQVVVGFYDTSTSIWPWASPVDAIHWIKAGAAVPERVVFIYPVQTNIALTVVGFFFGNQIGRRAS